MKRLLLIALVLAAACWGQQQTITFTATPQPPVPVSVTQVGTVGTTTYYYWVVAIYAGGNSQPAGPIATPYSNATLSSSNYNVVTFLAPTSPLSAVTGYDILRTTTPTSPTGACACAVATNQSGSPVNDQSNSLNAYTVNTNTGSVALYGDNSTQSGTILTDTGALAVKSGLTVAANSSFTGLIQPIGGLRQITNTIQNTVWGSALGVTGTASSTDIGTTVECETQIFVGTNSTLTGACVLGGSSAATDKFIVVLRNQAGTSLGNSALAGTTFAINNGWNCANFTGTISATGPNAYFVGVQTNGTTANVIGLYTQASLAPSAFACGQVTGQTFGTVTASLTMPTTFTSAKCPAVITY